jgi:hypothetical protein
MVYICIGYYTLEVEVGRTGMFVTHPHTGANRRHGGAACIICWFDLRLSCKMHASLNAHIQLPDLNVL